MNILLYIMLIVLPYQQEDPLYERFLMFDQTIEEVESHMKQNREVKFIHKDSSLTMSMKMQGGFYMTRLKYVIRKSNQSITYQFDSKRLAWSLAIDVDSIEARRMLTTLDHRFMRESVKDQIYWKYNTGFVSISKPAGSKTSTLFYSRGGYDF